MLFSRLFPVAPRLMLRSLAVRGRVRKLRALRPALAALPVAGAASVLVAPSIVRPALAANPGGVKAWTSGAQTYIRVRPSTSTPIVAQVGKHTPLYVWGKYQGWYRVQTQDDIFGWVHYDLINSPALGKVIELSSAAVQRTAKKSYDTTMYGTAAQLKAYYAKTGAPGAARGLKLMGVAVGAPTSSRPKTVKVKTAPSKAAPRKVATRRPAPRPAAPRVVLARPNKPSAPRVMTSGLAPRVPVNRAPVVRQVTPPVTAPAKTLVPVTALAPAPPVSVARKASAQTSAKTALKAAAKPKKLTPRQASAARKRDALRAKMGMTDKTPPLPIGQIAPVSPEDLMKARRAYLEARRKKLEGKAPDSADDKGENNGETLGGPKATESSFEFESAGGASNGDGRAHFVTADWSAERAPRLANAVWTSNCAPQARAAAQEDEAPKSATLGGPVTQLGDAGLDDEELKRWDSLPTLGALEVTTVASAQKKPKAAPSRGGSPRDRYKSAKNAGGDFRESMANQALSYRGRPYVFGSSSPARGFDCSGLIYFLLRQRGYNPPRTAAGYKTYGSAVARGQWKPGDLMLFANTYKRGISHIGIYIGNNNFVHAASTRQGVRVDSMNTKYYASKYCGARRVPTK